MLDTDDSQTRFSSDSTEVQEDEAYRPLSGLAIVAFVGSLLSFAAVIHPLLWVVPAIAIGLAFTAVWKLGRPDSVHSGKSLAGIALIVSLFLAGYATVRTMSLRQSFYNQSRLFAEAWIDLIRQDRVHEAHQLTASFHERYSGELSLEEFYSDKVGWMMRQRMQVENQRPEAMEMMQDIADMGMEGSPSVRLESFLRADIVSRLLSLPDDTEVRFVRNVSQSKQGRHLVVVQRFVAIFREDGQTKEYFFPIQLTRKHFVGEQDRHWQVQEMGGPKAPQGGPGA